MAAVSYTHLDVYKRQLLESPMTVAIMLIIGGVILIYIDKWFLQPVIHSETNITLKNSFVIGLWQTIAMAVSYTHLDVYKRQES